MSENPFFNKIYGQKKVKDLLNEFIRSGKIPHALLFNGSDGIGKDFFAIKFAQAVNDEFTSGEYFGKDSLTKIEHLEEPFIKYIIPLPRTKNETDTTGPTEKFSEDEIELLREELNKKIENPYYRISIPRANNIKISSIRDINKFISLDFSEVKYRVIIISNAHLMNEEAQNALLKNLEEPPENVIFILTTSQPSRLRETILSRCWKINFDPLNDEDLVNILVDYYDLDRNLAEVIAPFAEGSTNTAIKLSEMDFVNLQEKVISVLRYSLGKKYYSAFQELNSIIGDETAENTQIVLKMILTWINDLTKFRYNSNNFLFKDHLETLQKFNTKFPETDLTQITYELDRLVTLIKRNVNINLISSNLIFQLSKIVISKSS
jgi:DNA polymerase III subunit delta'